MHISETETETIPSQEERTFAALAHASIIANPVNLLGIIGAALIWVTQRHRSSFVAHHALQALVFQVIGLLVFMLLSLIWGGCLIISLVPVIIRPALYRTDLPISFWLAAFSGIIVVIIVCIWILYGLIGSWTAWNGQSFRYNVVDKLLHASTPTPPPPSEPAIPSEEEAV